MTIRLLCFLLFTVMSWCGQARATNLHLAWADNSNNESGFKVERKLGLSGTFSQVTTVGANKNSYTDTGLPSETTYCYRVRAFNAAGNSAYSNEACATTSTIMAHFESPAGGQPVSGIAVVNGWTFDTRPDRQISSVELFVDGVHSGDIPCCSERTDVQQAFPEFPLNHTQNSGWGITWNWGRLNPGMHTVQVKIENTTGECFSTQVRLITVIKPGGFEFLDRFDLSAAVARVEGQELVVEGIVVRDKATLQEREITAHFRWLTNSQSIGMVESVTTAEISSLQSLFSSFVTALSAWLGRVPAVGTVQANQGIAAVFENPGQGQPVFGVGVIHGWALAEEARAFIEEIELVVDGEPTTNIPCCSVRPDVAEVFPDNLNALNSGWGITFNYARLSAGFHTIGTQVRSSAGVLLSLNHMVEVVKPVGFEFLDQFDISSATARIEGQEIVLERVLVRDKLTRQSRVVEVRLCWFQNAQALRIVSFSV